MNSPLEYDESVIKEFAIEHDLETEAKLGFVRSQLEQIKAALYRERVELIISQTQVDGATDEVMKSNHAGKLTEHRLMIGQFVRSINVLTVLLDELEKSITE